MNPAQNPTPILAGFYPDPSICRTGEDFWLANSSFEYLPGVPIHHSRDLVHWEQVGHAFASPAALPLPMGDAASLGTFAPTLRYHEGMFYLVVTNMGDDPLRQIIVHTRDPREGWSLPVSVDGTPGIDPDLSWDEEGTCRLTWRAADFAAGFSEIRCVAINPLTGERLGEEIPLWQGAGMRDAEGPHLYRRGPWWYLMLAEGGTGLGHAVTMARARSLEGPWEEHPANPILTHRSLWHPVQATGHADLVPLDPEGWEGKRFAMVHLGIRQREPFPGFHLNGRETFLVGLTWEGEWPSVDEGAFSEAIAGAPAEHAVSEDFRGKPGPVAISDGEAWDLPDAWVSPGGLARPALERDEEGRLTFHAREDGRVPSLCLRVRDTAWRADLELELVGEARCEFGVYLAPEHQFMVEASSEAGAGSTAVGLRSHARVIDLEQFGETAALPGGERLHLWVRNELPEPGMPGAGGGPDVLVVGYRDALGDHELGRLDGRFLSTEVAGGFTGRMIAIRPLTGTIRLQHLSYTPLSDPGEDPLAGLSRPRES